jgi:hypothetical protein
MNASHAFAVLITAAGAVGILWIVTGLIRAAFRKPRGMATYLPKPRPDPRDWQGDFKRSMKP